MPDEFVSKTAAAQAIGCSRLGVSCLIVSEALEGSFSKVDGNIVRTVRWDSVEDYLRWRDSASPGQRRVRSIRNAVSIAVHPIGWIVRVLGPTANPG